MKYFVIVPCLLVAVCALSQEYQEKVMGKLMEIADTCIPEVGASDADVSELMEKKLPSRKEGKCLIACFSKKLGFMKDGKPSKEGTVAALESLKADDAAFYENFMKIVDKCHGNMEKDTETDECELAVKAATCIKNTGIEMGVDTDTIMG